MYAELLREQSNRFGFRVESHCLMTNYIHVVGAPTREDIMAKAMGRTHFVYSQYVRFFTATADTSSRTNSSEDLKHAGLDQPLSQPTSARRHYQHKQRRQRLRGDGRLQE